MKALGFILKFIGILVIVLVILVGLMSFLPRVLGYETANIVSGSMEPAIPVGSLVLAEKTEGETLENGDIIMFLSGTTAVTHRVISNDREEGTVRTKGDANEQEDMLPVLYDRILGKVILHVPVLGDILQFFTPWLGKVCALIVLATGAVLAWLGGRASHSAQKKNP